MRGEAGKGLLGEKYIGMYSYKYLYIYSVKYFSIPYVKCMIENNREPANIAKECADQLHVPFKPIGQYTNKQILIKRNVFEWNITLLKSEGM